MADQIKDSLLEAHIRVLEEIRNDVQRVIDQAPDTAAEQGWPEGYLDQALIELEARKRSLGVAIDHLRRLRLH